MRLLPFLMIGLLLSANKENDKENVHLPRHKINSNCYSAIKKFVPEGYVVMDQADGDLNGDGIADKILVLKLKRDFTEEGKRPVILLIGNQVHSFRKVAENENVLLSFSDGGIHGDPYHGISIKNGYFSFEHFGGSGRRWTQVITFKYDKEKQNWFLNKVGSESWHIDNPNKFKFVQFTKKDFGIVPFIDYQNDWINK